MSLYVERLPPDDSTAATDALRPELVLLHGWGMHSGVWSDWTPYLQRHFRLTLIDLPGLGRSAVRQPYRLEALADQIAAVAPANAFWLGWSLGGVFAAAVATRHPVAGVITLACNPCFVGREAWPGMEKIVFEQFQAQVAANPVKALQRFLMLQVQGDPQARRLLKTLKPLLASAASGSDALLPALALLGEDHRPMFAALRCPRLHLFGDIDPLVPAAIAPRMPCPDRSVIVPDCSHLPFLSAPEFVANTLLSFTQSVLDQRGGVDA